MSKTRPDKADVDAVEAFNRTCAVGGTVEVTFDDGTKKVTTTRSEAQLLSGHTPVVWLKGIAGCYLLERVKPLSPEQP